MDIRLSTDRFRHSEVAVTAGNVKIVVFNDSSGQLKASVQADGVSCFLPQLSKLTDLNMLLIKARDHINAVMVK